VHSREERFLSKEKKKEAKRAVKQERTAEKFQVKAGMLLFTHASLHPTLHTSVERHSYSHTHSPMLQREPLLRQPPKPKTTRSAVL
jgi:hypothetical protein